MRSAEIEAIGELAGDALAGACGFVEQMHKGIASRPFGVLGPVAMPVRVVHDGIAKVVYGSVRESLRFAPRVAGTLAAAGLRRDRLALTASSGSSRTLAALNGLHGDHLVERGSELALRMEIRHNGRAVPLTPQGVSAAFPDPSDRIAVFVHGLFESDESWRRSRWGGGRSQPRTYGEQLRDDLDFTPVYVRYNSGLRVARNGHQLAAMLDALVGTWPRPVSELVLIGHSTGALVVRSACDCASRKPLRWNEPLRHVFFLGSPHLETDFERNLGALGSVLGRLPETRALASLLNARSGGIKDLRGSSWLEEGQAMSFPPRTSYYFIAVRLADRPFGGLVADLLNLDLHNHPAVYEQIRSQIERSSARPALPPPATTA